MSLQIEENIAKILKTQNCKRKIESMLTTRRAKKENEQINKDRIALNFMLFQVVKDSFVTDHVHVFPCAFDLKGGDDNKFMGQVPKVGSYIRVKRMDFDLKSFNLVIYDYQYLGGAGGTIPSNCQKVNWNNETISQIIRKNNTVKGGQVLIDCYLNDKLSQTEPFQYPKVQFLTVKLLQSILAQPEPQQFITTNQKIQKISVPKLDVLQQQGRQSSPIEGSVKDQDINIKDLEL